MSAIFLGTHYRFSHNNMVKLIKIIVAAASRFGMAKTIMKCTVNNYCVLVNTLCFNFFIPKDSKYQELS